jgi:hypothetical protein
MSSLGMLAVIFDVRLRPQGVGDLFLWTWRDGLVVLELGDGGFIRARNMVLRGLLEVE